MGAVKKAGAACPASTDKAGWDRASVPVAGRSGLALFVYGTLTFGDIVEVLLGRRPKPSTAMLPGWRAARLPGRVYPGLVPAAGRAAAGRLLSGLSESEWAVLDDFEGDAYVLRPVKVVARRRTDYPDEVGAPAVPGGWSGLKDPAVAGAGAGTGASTSAGAGPGSEEGPVSVALTYVWRAVDDVLDDDWDSDWFESRWLDRYLARLRPHSDV